MNKYDDSVSFSLVLGKQRKAGEEIEKRPKNKNGRNGNSIRQINLRPGFSLSMITLEAETKMSVSYKTETPIIGFGCILAGDVENRNSNRIDNHVPSSAGIGGISFSNNSEGSIHKRFEKPVKILHVHLKPKVLESIFESDIDLLPRQLKTLIEAKDCQEFVHQKNMCLHARSVAHQIINGTPHGVPEKTYLEGKALELISLQIASLGPNNESRQKRRKLEPVEQDKIIAVGESLVEKMESPPSLKNLANSIGLSVNKLEQGFNEIFGMPVFTYLRECKMQKAKLLFLETPMNVSEVAWEVGYVNVSHFGDAFKKRFGILPKQFIKKSREI